MIYLVFTILVLVPCLIVLPALLNRRKILIDNPEMQNSSIALHRIEELASYEEDTRLEAEMEVRASLVDDVSSVRPVNYILYSPAKSLAVLVLLPLFAVALYFKIGNPELLNVDEQRPGLATGGSNSIPEINDLLLQLEQRIAEQPDNPRGWELAARTYMSLERYEEAEHAYSRLNQLVPRNPDFLSAWADATIMLDDNSYSSNASALVEQALEISPNHQNSLWIAALGASSLEQYDRALSHLESLRSQVADEPDTVEQLDRLISYNRGLAGYSLETANESQQALGKVINVTVNVDSHLVGNLDGSEVIFVIARSKNGPPAPLAVSTHRLEELPVTVSLSSAQAMIANMNIDLFDEIEVLARISRNGTPQAQPGDYTSQTVNVSGENPRAISVTIDSVVE